MLLTPDIEHKTSREITAYWTCQTQMVCPSPFSNKMMDTTNVDMQMKYR